MTRGKQNRIKPTILFIEIHKSVSDILNIPFSDRVNHKVFESDQKILALWAADCAEHVLPFFEIIHLKDSRPREAIDACRRWAATAVFRMGDIRRVSLDAHAAAKTAKKEDAKYAAHAAGQAVATAHVSTHALGCALYGIRAAAAHSGDVDDGLVKERSWQLERLRRIVEQSRGAC